MSEEEINPSKREKGWKCLGCMWYLMRKAYPRWIPKRCTMCIKMTHNPVHHDQFLSLRTWERQLKERATRNGWRENEWVEED